ncbi:MAG: HEPN domain-containing protein [Kiritimatiellae bacterium]|nr:HEPN domain-containing protein [Kiritimatiellia bacterium]MBQ3344462.1 HEPN domain-containing protein [Kiritimatiellia bacterium]
MKPGCESLLGKSKENFDLALELKEDGRLNAAANRFYYSAFQAVKAYAVSTGKMRIDENSGVHYKVKQIATDEDKKYRDVMEDACTLRVTADYLAEDIQDYELSSKFQNDIQEIHDHFKTLAISA